MRKPAGAEWGDRMEALAALRLMRDWGADEALSEIPVMRLDISGKPTAVARAAVVSARAVPEADEAADLEALAASVRAFQGSSLADTATHLVLGAGPEQAPALMLIGEAPGEAEDATGTPFCGPDGALLARMLADIGLALPEMRQAYAVPWRPPGDRQVTAETLRLFRPFLLRHIALVRPERVIALGGAIAGLLLGADPALSRLRLRWRGAAIPGLAAEIPLLTLTAPAAARRSVSARQSTWEDLRLLRRTLDGGDFKVTEGRPRSL